MLYIIGNCYCKHKAAYPLYYPLKKYYVQSADQEDLISIGTIGLIKGISSFDPSKGAKLATYAARCIENEILMYFRGQKKLQGEVSLSDSIDMDKEGNDLQIMDVVGVDDTMLEDLHNRDSAEKVRGLVRERLTARESEIIRLRYGLGGTVPLPQWGRQEIKKSLTLKHILGGNYYEEVCLPCLWLRSRGRGDGR